MSEEIFDRRRMSSLDIREMTFQNVVDNILLPSGIKIGGFHDELFLSMTDEEHEKMMCNICFLIANDCRLCDNDHVFCHACVFAWSLTFGENARKCPVCRWEQMEYNENEELAQCIGAKQVRCQEDACDFTSTLAEYMLHGHGEAKYSNAHVDFECLRPRLAQPHSATEASTSTGLSSSIRSQLLQSRTMIQQMMMLMRIEMQLRQQAVYSFQQSPEADSEQLPRVDDAVALNDQLSTISSVLTSMIRSSSVSQRSTRRRSALRDLPPPQRLRNSGFARSAALRRISNLSARLRDLRASINDTSTSEDESSDDVEVPDMENPAPLSAADDDLTWQQLNESDTETDSLVTARSSPDGMSAASSQSAMHPLPSLSMADSSASSVSPSISFEGQQITPRYVLCMNNCSPTPRTEVLYGAQPLSEPLAASGIPACELCTVMGGMSFFEREESESDISCHHAADREPLRTNDQRCAHAVPRQEQATATLLNPSVCTQLSANAAYSSHGARSVLAARMTDSPTYSAPSSRRTLERIVPTGRSLQRLGLPESLHSVFHNPPLCALPGSTRPPHLNYAARLRIQAAEERAHLPSEVSIRPWPPLMETGSTNAGNRRLLQTASGRGSRHAGTSSRSVVSHQLPTYQLPSRQSSGAVQHGSSAYRGRPSQPTRYSNSTHGNHTRMPRP